MNRIKILILTSFLLLMTSCSLFDTRVETIVTWEDGKDMKVKSKSDALVVVEKGGEKLTVDNRGRPGIIEQFLGALLLRPNTRQRDLQE